jgi:3-oxoacyl-[acyl-carrier-protein] synthase-3
MSVRACDALLAESGADPESIDVVMYFGSMWKDYAVWQAAPWIAHRLGAKNAYAVEYDNVSCGTPAALRMARAMLVAEPDVRNVLLVGACRESYLLDYGNARSRFMFNFGDGAAAALLVKEGERNELLGSYGITDGSLSLHVKVARGGSVHANDGYPFLDVEDPAAMKEQLDETSQRNFVRVAERALKRSGLTLRDVSFLCPLHMKHSMHSALCDALGVDRARAEVLDDTGHMSGVDTLFSLDRAVRSGKVRDGDVVLLVAAGTGYTWAASVVRWGPLA